MEQCAISSFAKKGIKNIIEKTTLVAHFPAGAPLLVRCASSIFGKKLLLVAHHVSGAPLVSITLMAHQIMVRHFYIVVAHHMSGAPLVAISSIALFLVVVFVSKQVGCTPT